LINHYSIYISISHLQVLYSSLVPLFLQLFSCAICESRGSRVLYWYPGLFEPLLASCIPHPASCIPHPASCTQPCDHANHKVEYTRAVPQPARRIAPPHPKVPSPFLSCLRISASPASSRFLFFCRAFRTLTPHISPITFTLTSHISPLTPPLCSTSRLGIA